MPRAFTAIDIPQEIAEKLSEVQEEIGIGRPVKAEKMHITLEFFEDLTKEDIEEIKNHLQKLDFEAFEVKVKDLGVFPSEKYIRVIWAGIESEKIREIYEKSSGHSISSDNDHEFRPHVTLARVDDVRRGDKKRIHEALEEYSGVSFGSFEVEKLKLYESSLKSDGSEYNEIYLKNL